MVTAAPAGGEARVVDSADLMPKVVDFLGVGDAFTPAVSKLWRGAAATLKQRMSLIPPPRNLPKKYEADYVGRYEVFWGS